uniref:Ig-like domain-containing protein n=1 Tax=Cyprinus carpio TaxID=7962 RepID=A0A8C1LND5_CYPCA
YSLISQICGSHEFFPSFFHMIFQTFLIRDINFLCSVDSHITPEHIEEVLWRKTDGDILVLLFQNNETLPDSSDERYRDRVELFTAEIPKGNFSLRLKSVRTEDKGVYMCLVFAGGLSANATVVLEQLGELMDINKHNIKFDLVNWFKKIRLHRVIRSRTGCAVNALITDPGEKSMLNKVVVFDIFGPKCIFDASKNSNGPSDVTWTTLKMFLLPFWTWTVYRTYILNGGTESSRTKSKISYTVFRR